MSLSVPVESRSNTDRARNSYCVTMPGVELSGTLERMFKISRAHKCPIARLFGKIALAVAEVKALRSLFRSGITLRFINPFIPVVSCNIQCDG